MALTVGRPTTSVPGALQPPVIELRDVSKKYEGRDVGLDHATFSIRRGELVFLVGHSGPGKPARINTTGTTVVVATHDHHLVDRMKRRVIELQNGAVVRDVPQGMYNAAQTTQELGAVLREELEF